MSAGKEPSVQAQMLIRKPSATVFGAFIDPEITRHFWFSKGSGRLEAGKTVTWDWEMYGVSAMVIVDEIVPGKKIAVRWGEPRTGTGSSLTHVDFEFREVDAQSTYVVITNYGFEEKPAAQMLSEFVGLAGGFTTVLDGLKAYLEHGIGLNLIADKFPPGIAAHD